MRLHVGTFQPAGLRLDLNETRIVKWVNEDPRRYILADKNDECDVVPAPDDEFDDGTLEPGNYRVFASVDLQRISGAIDSRPGQ